LLTIFGDIIFITSYITFWSFTVS